MCPKNIFCHKRIKTVVIAMHLRSTYDASHPNENTKYPAAYNYNAFFFKMV